MRSGVGKLAALLICGGPLSAAAAGASAGDWIDGHTWPYTYTAGAQDRDRLVVVEQAGIDLRVRQVNGAVSNSPLGRMGPEFVYVSANETAELAVEPMYPAMGDGRFRVTQIVLDTEALEQAGRTLAAAGVDFGSGAYDQQMRACAEYGRVAQISGLATPWLHLGRLLTASCHLETGQKIPDGLLESTEGEELFLSVPPYRGNWLEAEHLHVEGFFDRADHEIEIALEKAKRELVAHPDIDNGIRRDIAEIKGVVGGNAAMLAFVLGGGDTSDSVLEKRRLLDRAEHYSQASLAAAEKLQDAYILGSAYDWRAAVHFVREENTKVIEDLLVAKTQIEKTGNPEWLLPILGSIGDFHKRWGELRSAQAAYLEALRIVAGNTTNGKYADTYDNIGTFYFDIGDFHRAKDYVETSIRLSRATGRETRANTNSIQLALILEEENDYPAAKALNEELLNHFVRMDEESKARFWSPYRIMTQSALSRIERKLGNLDDAFRLSSQVIEQLESRAINVATDLPRIYINHAEILFARNDKAAAFATLDKTIAKYRNEPIEMVDLLAAKLDFLQRTDSAQQAIAIADQVFGIIESQRMGFDTVRLGPYWSGRTNDIYASHIDYLLQIGHDRPMYEARAFETAERARATGLRLRRLEMLLAKNDANAEARARWIDIVSEIRKSQGHRETEQDNLELERRIGEARERYFASHGAVPSTAKLEIRSIEDIQRRLAENSVAMQFVTGPQKVWRFDITAHGWSVTELGNTSGVRVAIEAARSELSELSAYKKTSTILLSDVLLKDLSLDLSGKSLLISPSYNLDSFPFSALLVAGKFISDLATITLVPSFSEYFEGRQQSLVDTSQNRLEIAVLADPAFGSMTAANHLGDAESFRSWSASLERLPASALEAKELSTFYAEDRRLVLLGPEATQRRFFDTRVRNAKVIHIATHGYFNEEIPELIGFAMAKDRDDETDDGFVSMAEISAQDFNADLVVISACNTGRGFEIRGEGNMSLARTFLAQGVDSVVSTLWPVSDSASALFMREFYRSLNEDKRSLAESLQSAQRVLRESPRYRHPYFWSGYVLTSAADTRIAQ
jgi:CHAT domain-containing protein